MAAAPDTTAGHAVRRMILVGYRAENPLMGYVLEVIEAYQQRYSDLRPNYAFTGSCDNEIKMQMPSGSSKA